MMKRGIFIVLAALALSACMRNVDSYNSDPYIVSTLSTYSGQKISIAEFESSIGEGGVNQCRGYSIITNPGEGGLVRYIQDAFVSELELANAYSPDSPIVLKGNVTQISLSTLTGGEWIIKMTLISNNGRSISAREQLHFKTNIVGQSACQVAGDTYFYAVQNLLRKLVSSPNFPRLLEPSSYPQPKPETTGTQSSGKQPNVQLQATEISPLETSTYSQPAAGEIVPLEVTTQTQPVSVQSTPVEVTVQPKKEISTSDCSIEKQIQRQSEK
ncbi:hypothetical protein NB640_04555 [Oxalobacter vibrioformis]|uniref:Lipoprotein n=1 Tax=Oxalobacter vibrioformis TaxID=933080 RepID=A0A9E9M0G6_9BURK|nr:hypothetical protein [Oxalobacter vibrioformis]WAW10914.1 hypothetical protein NB640_04555 [Oxalobacter vibrioformis]